MIPYEFLHYFYTRGVSCRGSNVALSDFRTRDLVRGYPRQLEQGAGGQIQQLPPIGPEDVIPQGRADPVPNVVVFVMMAKVILLQPE